jgi:hypothetical protein
MIKYIIYAIVILIVLFLIDAMGLYDVPYIDPPKLFTGQEEIIKQPPDALKELAK